MTAYINLSGKFAYLSIYLMNWQRGYKLSLLSQLPLFRIITTIQIYLGHFFFFFFIKSQDCIFSCQKCPIAAAAMKSPGKCRAVPLTARSNPTPLLYAMSMTSAHKQGGLNRTFRNQKGSPLGFWGSNPNKTLWNKDRSRLTIHSTPSQNWYDMQLGTQGHQATVSYHH